MKQYKSLQEVKENLTRFNKKWVFWDFQGTPWDRGLCLPEQKVAILLRNPLNNCYFVFLYGYPANHYDWSEDAGDFKIYAFRPKDMKWQK